MSEHTPGPWTVWKESPACVLAGSDQRVIVEALNPINIEIAEGNAARVVECVNAMEGKDDPSAFVSEAETAIEFLMRRLHLTARHIEAKRYDTLELLRARIHWLSHHQARLPSDWDKLSAPCTTRNPGVVR